MNTNQTTDTFDEWARSGRADRMETSHGDVAAQVIEGLLIRPGFQILDLGCGTGWATRLLAESAPGVGAVGVDASPEMVARAEELSSLRIRARYETGSFEALDFPDARFDIAFSMEALYYASDLPRAISELLRVLKPGGAAEVIVDLVEGRPGTASWADALGLELAVHSPQAWGTLFEEAGFEGTRLARVVDRRGAGDEADFEPGDCFPDWESYVAFHSEGSLHLHAVKPS
ncbi:MAG: class I SAM-dependent methyltransferase [Planctomycetota bacterium]|jgi:ubiquinone/menaquinone biosynthesis C-methylase UbiE|nr:class I SAM-dependent methyltransferase [Planctomycetota bacterium]MDP6762076.1 class I SAM-dependent methyltransferase [Planctomycetota bacterium]MDP6989175.1 class I SAM-dependent methyltransferase [Planctomycetota bacterium]